MKQYDLFDTPFHAILTRRKIFPGEQWTTLLRAHTESELRARVDLILTPQSRAQLSHVHLCAREDDGRVVILETIQLESMGK